VVITFRIMSMSSGEDHLGPVHTGDKVEFDFDVVALLSLFCRQSTKSNDNLHEYL